MHATLIIRGINVNRPLSSEKFLRLHSDELKFSMESVEGKRRRVFVRCIFSLFDVDATDTWKQ